MPLNIFSFSSIDVSGIACHQILFKNLSYIRYIWVALYLVEPTILSSLDS